MTVLSVCQLAASRIGITVPSAVFADTSRTAVELQAAVNEAAYAMRDDFDWQRLRTIYTITGDGNYTGFDLPSDFARMLKKSRIWPSDEPNSPVVFMADSDEWLAQEVRDVEAITRRATIYGNQLKISPTLESGITVKYFYISNKIVIATGGSAPTKTGFTLDTDSFALDERLLTLSLIWRWKQANGRPYEQDKQDYEEALDKKAGTDRGSRVLHVGKRRIPSDVVLAYPRSIEA